MYTRDKESSAVTHVVSGNTETWLPVLESIPLAIVLYW